MEQERASRIRRVLWVVLGLNLVVTALELGYGWWVGSSAIVADGYHSLVDSSNNLVALAMARIASAPADPEHPYGHLKFEVIGSVVIGLMILGMVWQVGAGAVSALLQPSTPPVFGPEAYAVLGVTLLLNILITTYEHRAAARYQSPLLGADAKHTLSDIVVKLGVLAGVVGVQLGYPAADPIIALVVLGFIGWVGFGILRHGVGVLADEAAIPGADIEAVAQSVEQVARAHQARSRGAPPEVRVDLVIDVDPALRVGEAHEIAHLVEAAVCTRWPEVIEVVVHVEPADPEP